MITIKTLNTKRLLKDFSKYSPFFNQGLVDSYRVAIVGCQGVGKTALIQQFSTSECINAFDCPIGGEYNPKWYGVPTHLTAL